MTHQHSTPHQDSDNSTALSKLVCWNDACLKHTIMAAVESMTVSCDNKLGNTCMYRLHDGVYACGQHTTKLGIRTQAMCHKTQKHTHTRGDKSGRCIS